MLKNYGFNKNTRTSMFVSKRQNFRHVFLCLLYPAWVQFFACLLLVDKFPGTK